MDFRIGFWDVLTLYKPEGLQILLKEIDNYRLDRLKCRRFAGPAVDYWRKKIHTVYYSGHQKNHAFGTGFVVR